MAKLNQHKIKFFIYFLVTIRTCFVELFSLYEKLFASASYELRKWKSFFPVFLSENFVFTRNERKLWKIAHRACHVTYRTGPKTSDNSIDWNFYGKLFCVSHKVIFNLFILKYMNQHSHVLVWWGRIFCWGGKLWTIQKGIENDEYRAIFKNAMEFFLD